MTAARAAEVDRQQRRRVAARISSHVLHFCRWRLRHGQAQFRLQELTDHVQAAFGGKLAPDSPRRILCLLRRQGLLKYEVVSRAQSLYRLMPPSSQATLRTWEAVP